jgi:hypothetical protein
MSLFLAEGLEWLKRKNFLNKQAKNREGYRGIMGQIPTLDGPSSGSGSGSSIEYDPEFTDAALQSNNLSQGIADYTTKYNALKTTTNNYLGMTAQNGSDIKKNYNIFVNTPMDASLIKETPYTGGGCIANGLSNNGALAGLTVDAPGQGFNALYPAISSNSSNFLNAQAAINACKLWAADSQTVSAVNPPTTLFAVTKDGNLPSSKFKCYYGNSLTNPSPTPYTVKKINYKIKTSSDATRGGLFGDSTIGVYNEILSALPADPNNPYNAVNTTALTGYGACDKFVGGELNRASIMATLGSNCTNVASIPVNIRYVYIRASQDPSLADSYIQIAQLVVYGFNNGIAKNLTSRGDLNNSPKPVANSGVGVTTNNGVNTFTNKTDYSWGGVGANVAIDGTVSARAYPGIYHSTTVDRNEWWSVDLGKNYPVYQVDYYNRAEHGTWRAIGMQMYFKDNNGAEVQVKSPTTGALVPFLTFKSDSAKQSFIISQ